MFKLMGSAYFFANYPDFKSKDLDFWEIVEVLNPKNESIYSHKAVFSTQPVRECFRFKKLNSADEHVAMAFKSPLPMVVGKFLVPEFCEEIGFKVEDLPKLQPLIDSLDEEHTYEKIIYEAYLENKGFYLTQEQRDRAYLRYKATRSY